MKEISWADGIQGSLVNVNVPSYNTGHTSTISEAEALVVIDLQWRHLVLTNGLGAEMLFLIEQHRDEVQVVPNKPRFSKDECVKRLKKFLNSKPDVDICLVKQPFMDIVAKWSPSSQKEEVEMRDPHHAICLFNSADDSPAVFLSAYLDKHHEKKSKKFLDVETRFLVQKSDYFIVGHSNVNVKNLDKIHDSRLDVIKTYSTLWENPDTGLDNWEDVKVKLHAGRHKSKVTLKQDSKNRIRSQIVDTLVALAEKNPVQGGEDPGDDLGRSDVVIGEYEQRYVVWVERDAEKSVIKRKVYIKHGTIGNRNLSPTEHAICETMRKAAAGQEVDHATVSDHGGLGTNPWRAVGESR